MELFNKVITACCIGIVGLLAIRDRQVESNIAVAKNVTPQVQIQTQPVAKQHSQQRILKLSLTVDRPSFLRVREGDFIKAEQVIADNTYERNRLLSQRKSIELQLKNLQSKPLPKPTPPIAPPKAKPIPQANYAEEQAAIAQADMKLAQAQSLLEARTPQLKADNPEQRAEAEKAEAALASATQKVEEQQQLLLSMKDMNLQEEILRHEEAKLQQLDAEQAQAKSALEQAQAKWNTAGIEQQQQLQQLQLTVRIAQSELELANSRLLAAQSRRELVEYAASVDAIERSQQEAQLQQEYNRQEQVYAQAIRDRDYQLAQLSLSLAAVDEKIQQIPVVRSPKDGYIRRIKPWIGNNGRYTTNIIISSHLSAKPANGQRSSNTSSNSNAKQQPNSTKAE
jgi:DNA repair exonuclease SbcCD ATPase subunit